MISSVLPDESPLPGATLVQLRPRAGISCTFSLVVAGALLRCPPLAVLARRRVVRLASHPAMPAKMHNLSLHEA